MFADEQQTIFLLGLDHNMHFFVQAKLRSTPNFKNPQSLTFWLKVLARGAMETEETIEN